LQLSGEDLRPLPLEERRARLRKALRGSGKALRLSEHLKGDGAAIFRHACTR
jgi:bifunctional non-homologous end joining protein LigD